MPSALGKLKVNRFSRLTQTKNCPKKYLPTVLGIETLELDQNNPQLLQHCSQQLQDLMNILIDSL